MQEVLRSSWVERGCALSHHISAFISLLMYSVTIGGLSEHERCGNNNGHSGYTFHKTWHRSEELNLTKLDPLVEPSISLTNKSILREILNGIWWPSVLSNRVVIGFIWKEVDTFSSVICDVVLINITPEAPIYLVVSIKQVNWTICEELLLSHMVSAAVICPVIVVETCPTCIPLLSKYSGVGWNRSEQSSAFLRGLQWRPWHFLVQRVTIISIDVTFLASHDHIVHETWELRISV